MKNKSIHTDFHLHHIGWITKDYRIFEKFWVAVLGYRQVTETLLTSQMAETLFNTDSPALIRRYRNPEAGPEIEIHQFVTGTRDSEQDFYQFGINHICLHVKSTRQNFLVQLPDDIERKIYKNPAGYENIFIRDYEGNWIELRESL